MWSLHYSINKAYTECISLLGTHSLSKDLHLTTHEFVWLNHAGVYICVKWAHIFQCMDCELQI